MIGLIECIVWLLTFWFCLAVLVILVVCYVIYKAWKDVRE